MYIHALIFLGCAGYVQYKDEHVRVDIFYRDATNKYKNKVNLMLGILFLIPMVFVIGYFSIGLWKNIRSQIPLVLGIRSQALDLPYFYIYWLHPYKKYLLSHVHLYIGHIQHNQGILVHGCT